MVNQPIYWLVGRLFNSSETGKGRDKTVIGFNSELQVHVLYSLINQSITQLVTRHVSLKKRISGAAPFVTRSRMKVCKSTF